MFSLEEKKRLREDIRLFKYLKDSHVKKGKDLFSIIPECRASSNWLKSQETRFQLNVKKNILTIRAIQQWNQ